MIQKHLEINNKYNKKLSAIIELPEDNLKDILIISHCFTCSKIYKLYNNISKTLVDKNYAVVRYDVMGLGNSEGSFSQSTFSTNIDDLLSVYEYISKNFKTPKYLFGHSLGALVSIKAASNLESVIGVATVGSPSDFNNLIKLFSHYEDELTKSDKLNINLAGRSIDIGLDFLKDLRDNSAVDIIEKFNKSILIFHSDSDLTVPYRDGLNLFELIKSDKSFITLNNTDHLASKIEDSKYIAEILSLWFDKKNYLAN